MGDRRFIEQAVISSLEGIEMGGIAMNRAVNQIVKEIAEDLVLDHSRMTVELVDLARKKGVPMPATTVAGNGPLFDELRGIGAQDFDRRFMEALAGQQKVAMSTAREEVQTGDDAEVREFASRFLEKLEEQLWAVESILSEEKDLQ